MGLLDDAIREHLELKRLRGADPELVLREESEAFGVARHGGSANGDGAAGASDDLGDRRTSPAVKGSERSGLSTVGQETAELDMRTVLDGPNHEAVAVEKGATGRSAAASPSVGDSLPGGSASEDSLEWEIPKDAGTAGVGEGDPLAGEPEEPVEDVLEETPDFLRDTPEQERLWFEQRPPRDFDFDK